MTTRKGFSKKSLADRIKRDAQFAANYRKAVSETIGDALRQARQAAGVSQKVVADRMGVSESRVTQVEGEAGASLTLRSLRRYAKAVGCRVNIQLIDVATEKPTSTIFVGDDRVTEETTFDPSAGTRTGIPAGTPSKIEDAESVETAS